MIQSFYCKLKTVSSADNQHHDKMYAPKNYTTETNNLKDMNSFVSNTDRYMGRYK